MSTQHYISMIQKLRNSPSSVFMVRESFFISEDGELPFDVDTVTLLCTNPKALKPFYYVHQSHRVHAISEGFRLLSRGSVIAKKSTREGYVIVLCI